MRHAITFVVYRVSHIFADMVPLPFVDPMELGCPHIEELRRLVEATFVDPMELGCPTS